MTRVTSSDEPNNGITVEEISDCEAENTPSDYSKNCSPGNSNNSIATLPLEYGLSHNSAPPVFGSVSVKQSENVHFGNNTYFNGPVTIKQLVHTDPGGIDNISYINKDDDNSTPGPTIVNNTAKWKTDTNKPKTFVFKQWHIILIIICLIITLGAICIAILFSNKGFNSQNTENVNEPDKEGMIWSCLLHDHLNEIVALMVLVVQVYLLIIMKLLLSNTGSGSPVIALDSNLQFSKKEDPLQVAPYHLRIVDRSDWLAQPVEGVLDKLKLPAPWVIISHTATADCQTQSECVLRVRLIQSFHIESRNWFDIGYNFLIGGDGSAYIGRGWDYVGAHTKGYNNFSIGISFIGTFNHISPPKIQVEACEKLIELGVKLGKLSKDYKLFGHRQLWATLSPGDKVYDIISKWPHFEPNVTENLPTNRRRRAVELS